MACSLEACGRRRRNTTPCSTIPAWRRTIETRECGWPRSRSSEGRSASTATFFLVPNSSVASITVARKVPLLGPPGIFKPAVLPDMPLSITTVPVVEGRERPYEDEVGEDGLLAYRYRGSDPRHRDNAGLRRALERQVPLVYFHGVDPGWYTAIFPRTSSATIPAASPSPSRPTSQPWLGWVRQIPRVADTSRA